MMSGPGIKRPAWTHSISDGDWCHSGWCNLNVEISDLSGFPIVERTCGRGGIKDSNYLAEEGAFRTAAVESRARRSEGNR